MNATELSELKQVIEFIRSISKKHYEVNELQQKIQVIKHATENECGMCITKEISLVNQKVK